MPDVLDRAIAAHGGRERFERAQRLVVDLRSGGAAFLLRMHPRGLDALPARVWCHEPRTEIEDWPRRGRRGIFTPTRVAIETDGGDVVSERADPREAFRRSLRRQFRWDQLDVLYFAGYAMWNYLTTPWLLARPGIASRELDDGRLAVTFPLDLPTHSREQTFTFSEDGLITRLDYTAEVFGGWARAAHVCRDHREFGGLVFPTRRKVTPRGPGGRVTPFPTLVHIAVDRVSVE